MIYYNGTECVDEAISLPPAGAMVYSSMAECESRHGGKIDLDMINARKAQMIASAKARKEKIGERKPCNCGNKNPT